MDRTLNLLPERFRPDQWSLPEWVPEGLKAWLPDEIPGLGVLLTIIVLLLLNVGVTTLGMFILGLYTRASLQQSISRPRSITQEIVGDQPDEKPKDND